MTFRRTTCPHCRAELEQGQRIHPACVDGWLIEQAAKAKRKADKAAREKAKVERAAIRKSKIEKQGIYYYIKKADDAFAAYVRKRDQLAGHLCVSSGRPLNWNVKNQVDAGHYRSRGAASHLRYNEDNCHAQSKAENRFLSGNAVEYRIRLIKRIGIDRVEALECNNSVHKWQREELIEITLVYRQKLKEMKE